MKDRAELQIMKEQWPEFDPGCLEPEKRDAFENRKKAVDLYVKGAALTIIHEATGIKPAEVIRLFNKCMLQKEDGTYVGYVGLNKYQRQKKNCSKLDRLFQEYPEIKDAVIGNFEGDKKQTLERNMRMVHVHARFKNACKEAGIGPSEYPFTTVDNGYQAVRTFLLDYQKKNEKAGIKRQGKDAVQKFGSTGAGEEIAIDPVYPYNVVQIDGHYLDYEYSVEYEDKNGNIKRKAASRLWVICVIDKATRAIVGYSVSPYRNYNQQDLLEAIKASVKPHERVENTLGLPYPENGGFPSECVEKAAWASFDMVMMDNAKAHLADNVVKKLELDYGMTLHYGAVSTPETRGIIERFFRTIEEGGFHRLPGTTGSSIKDTKRNKPEKEAAKYGITYEDVVCMIDHFIAEYNNSANSALAGQTPMQVLKNKIENLHMYPHRISREKRDELEKLHCFFIERKIRGGYKNGNRLHISYEGCDYYPKDCLSMSFAGKKIQVEINPDDVSRVRVFLDDGTFLCEMIAKGIYKGEAHSLRTRKWLQKERRENFRNNQTFAPATEEIEMELRKREAESKTARTKISIMDREKKKNESKRLEGKPDDRTDGLAKETTPEDGYTEEEMTRIYSMPIEEAYAKGLI